MGLAILDLSKTVMFEFSHNYLKPKYDKNVKLCYMDTDSFIVYVKTDDVYKDTEARFDTSNFEIGRHYLRKEIKK